MFASSIIDQREPLKSCHKESDLLNNNKDTRLRLDTVSVIKEGAPCHMSGNEAAKTFRDEGMRIRSHAGVDDQTA
ncbi:hypothetical protein EYF80_030442 [Liparis tanakae]|uniref:Uncharacterized protein n=1 Tax=Liparis tanakae TaxID=230148 RepID=A0A4Z2H0P8_9TELE|nr:hypothetical protein EYF80_030442 [Liparis tanakae]